MAENELVALQVSPEAPKPEATSTKTDMVMPPERITDRLRHFPEDVYDLSAESHLSKFLKVLLGDAGVGQLRKRLLVTRMQSTLQGTHFFDLDRFYGPLFGLRRNEGEVLDFDPYTQTALTSEWDEAIAKDASFRSRIEQFSKAISYGPTPTGMELAAEALLSVDCDVYESFLQADSAYQTYAELEDQYGDGTPGGTYADLEGVSYGTLEGEGLPRISGDERRVFTVRPKRRITLAEAHDLRRVLDRIKPAEARFIIDASGIPLHDPLSIGSATADSVHWEIISKVAAVTPTALDPYQVSSGVPVEQPRPPFAGYQGEAWSYVADLSGVSASYRPDDGLPHLLPPQRVTMPNGFTHDFSAEQAVLPRRMIQGGRIVSDAIFVAHPYVGPRGVPTIFEDRYIVQRQASELSRLYADGIPMDALNRMLKEQPEVDPFQQNPEHRYWVGAERPMEDPTVETIEVRLTGDRLVNYVSFETARYPHEVVAEVFEAETNAWIEVHRQVILDSTPRVVGQGPVTQHYGHPMHSLPNHWEKVSVRTPAINCSRLRISLRRVYGSPPVRYTHTATLGQRREAVEIPYSLALRSLDLGYRVTSRADFATLDPDGDGVIGTTRDVAGSLVQFEVHEHEPQNLLTDTGYWRSEPQPVNYAVVNLYLDTRGPGNGDGQVIDRFFLDPTHTGAHFTIYYSNDPQDTDATEGFYEERAWTPIPRDYTLQKGYVHLPPTRARYWKFEFTSLTAEPYESFLPINRKVRLFPRHLVHEAHRGYGKGDATVPDEALPSIDVVRENRYDDALEVLGVAPSTTERDGYLSTEALYLPDLDLQQRLRNESWVFGFTPWHQGEQAPRFSAKARHVYDEVEVRHATKVAFFVGLRAIEAYRTKWEADDDTQVYFDTFDDFRNLTPGFTWAFEPGFLTTSGSAGGTVEAVSRTFSSKHNVTAIQFATEQANPQQLVPDHDFQDPALSDYEWSNPDSFLRVGDAQLIYSPQDHSVLHLRYVVPPPRAVDRTGGLVQSIVQPVFTYRPYEIADEAAAEATEGGIASPLLGLSPEGRVYAAARFTVGTTLSNPLYLQIIDSTDDTVLAEKPIEARRGETVEEYLAYDIPAPETVVRVRLVQRGKSNDAWRLDTLSLFDEGIVWEFSVNGGTDWYPAKGIRNNDNGVLTFPEVGNQLRFRVRGHRPRMWVSAIKIRPWYVGKTNARQGGTHRGPNVSSYDHDTPIHEDPMFTGWKEPVPYWWYAASRRFPILPPEGVPIVNEFSRFYGRPITDDISGTTDSVSAKVFQQRSAEDWIPLTGDWATRPLPINWRIHRPVVGPVGRGVPDLA